MSLVEVVRRLLGRSREHADVTPPDVRVQVIERQLDQEAQLRRKARLRALDLQAEAQAGWVPRKRP